MGGFSYHWHLRQHLSTSKKRCCGRVVQIWDAREAHANDSAVCGANLTRSTALRHALCEAMVACGLRVLAFLWDGTTFFDTLDKKIMT